MGTRAQVIELLKAGHSYETAARALRIPASARDPRFTVEPQRQRIA